jgi:ribosomal protein S11
VIVDVEVPEPGGSLTYTDPYGKATSWRLTGATAGTGFANARKYDVAYC